MIKQVIKIKQYWTIIVYYNIDYNRLSVIKKDVNQLEPPLEDIDDVFDKLQSGVAKGVTINNPNNRITIVLINKSNDKYDLINTVFHEVYHVHSFISEYYNLVPNSEPSAELIGFIIQKMYRVLKLLI